MEARFDSAGHADNSVMHEEERTQARLADVSCQFFLLVVGVETPEPVQFFAASTFAADVEKAAGPQCAV